jgi:hypothetical protein
MSDENNLGPPPSLVRQVAGDLHPDVPPELDYRILPPSVDDDPLLQINGQLGWELRPNGLNGYTLDDFENIARNQGWYVSDGEDWECETIPDSDSDSDDEEETEVENNPVFNNAA